MSLVPSTQKPCGFFNLCASLQLITPDCILFFYPWTAPEWTSNLTVQHFLHFRISKEEFSSLSRSYFLQIQNCFPGFVSYLLTKLQGLEINPVSESRAAHLIAALHTNTVVGGMLQALHAVGKRWHWGDFSGDHLVIW